MKQSILNLSLVIFIVQLSACSTTKKSEADRFKDMRSGLVYKTYQKASIKAMKPVARKYNKKLVKENKAQSGEAQIHALLSLIWMGSTKFKYALAESEYAVKAANNPEDRYAALTIHSLTMHGLGWHQLAKQQSIEAGVLVKSNDFSNRYNNMLVLVHVVGSALALQEGNIPYIASEVRDLGVLTKRDWLVQLGDATLDVYSGANAKAISRLEKLKSNPDLSAAERKGVASVSKAVEAGGKDASKAVAKAVVLVALDVGIKSSPLTPVVLEKLPEKYRDKLTKKYL